MTLKKILDPQARYVFLVSEDLAYAFAIVHVQEHHLYFTSKRDIPLRFERGYFLAPEGAGIVNFDRPFIEIMRPKDGSNMEQKIFRFDFSRLDFAISNRRLFLRHELKDYIPVAFSFFGEQIVGKLINISEGGLRMCVDTPIQKNLICQFEIKLGRNLTFRTDGMVVYSEKEEQGGNCMVGISFVAPEFFGAEDKQKYFKAKKRLISFLLKRSKAC